MPTTADPQPAPPAPSGPPATAPRRRSLPRWARWTLAGLGLLILLLALTPFVVGPFIKQKLQWMVESHLNASLDVGQVRYLPPYTVTLDDARLVTPGPDGAPLSLFNVDHVELQLAEIPRKGKPLVIERFRVEGPQVHLIQTADGLYGRQNLLKPRDKKKAAGPAPKLSDMLRLRHVTIEGGQVTFEDRRKPGTVPLVWKKLNLDLDTQPRSAALYAFDFTADNKPLATFSSTGTFDIDKLILDAAQLVLDVHTDIQEPDSSPLPAQVQSLLNRYQVRGALRFTAASRIPLKQAEAATFNATIDLTDGRADHPRWPAALDGLAARFQASRDKPDAPVSVAIAHFRARSGPTTLLFDRGTVTVDPARSTWKLAKLDGTIIGPEDRLPASAPSTINPADRILGGVPTPVPPVPPLLPLPAATAPTRPSKLQNVVRRYEIGGRVEFTAAASGQLPLADGRSIPMPDYELVAFARRASFSHPMLEEPVRWINGGPIRLINNVLTVQNISARYDYDRAALANVRIPLDGIADQVRLEEVDLTLAFDRNTQRYPALAQKAIDFLHPQGEVHVGGSASYVFKPRFPRYDYALNLTTDDLSLAVTDYLLPVEHVRTSISADRNQATIRTFRAQALDGNIVANATVATGGALAYDVEGSVEGADLRKAWDIYKSKGGALVRDANSRVSGKLSANYRLHNTGPGVENLKADGEFEVVEAEFFGAPVLSDVAKAARISDGAFTGSEAAGLFQVSDQTVRLTNLAIGAPAIGVQGRGAVAFNGSLDLRLVVAPLNDWKDKLKQTGIPLVGDVAGGIQKLINTATRSLLYEFAVTGTAKQPKVTPVPVPVLTEGAARIFSAMIKPEEARRQKLLDRMKQQGAAPRPG